MYPKTIHLLDQLIASLQQSIHASTLQPVADPPGKNKTKKKGLGGGGKGEGKEKQIGGVDPDLVTFSECDLRVSEIVQCWKHPESTYLYCQKILVGKELREIASGLQEYIPIAQMKGKVIVFANLKPRPLGGFTSNGMVICASNQTQTEFDLLCPQGSVGERVYLEGYEHLFAKGEQILPVIKKKTLEKCKEHFRTDAEGFVTWKGVRLRTKAGFITSKIRNGRVD